jgi:hypothetical protein
MSDGASLASILLQNIDVTGGSGSDPQSSTEFVGGLIGFGGGGTISDVSASGSVASGDNSAAGGLVGVSGISMRNCRSLVAVSNGSDGEVGGLAGGTIRGSFIVDSSSAGNVSGDIFLGGLVGFNFGTIEHSFSTAIVTGTGTNTYAGGMVGMNQGRVSRSSASGAVNCEFVCGGLAGLNGGGVTATISQSYSTGNVSAGNGGAGGLVGTNMNSVIANSYATGSASGPDAGGLIAGNQAGVNDVQVMHSYSTGVVAGRQDAGGLIAVDDFTGSLKRNYWDTTTSGVTDKGQGAGNIENDPGIKGLGDIQLRSGLPKGFSPPVWAENPGVNGGLPYLVGNPPRK